MKSSEIPSPSIPKVVWSIVVSLTKTSRPKPGGNGTVDHASFGEILGALGPDAAAQLADHDHDLSSYLKSMEAVSPDGLTRDEALAYWLNVYNAAALRLGGRAFATGEISVLGIPGGFSTPVVTVDGESLSLDDIEHGKVRRFRDPRIHAGLVCGSISCPTLRRQPFTGDGLDEQLDDQMRTFLRDGALRVERDRNRVVLSPVFSWFSRDFVQPHRMPTLLPALRSAVLDSVLRWATAEDTAWIYDHTPEVTFSHYDWRIGCAVG